MNASNQDPRQQPGGMIHDTKQALNVLAFLSQVIASPVEPMIRTRFGLRYFGFPSFAAVFAVPMWTLLWPGHDPRPLWLFWVLFLLMQLRARIESSLMAARGVYVHSRYNGWPRLASIFRRTDEVKLKEREPLLVFLAGVALLQVSEPLGTYLMIAGVCLGLNLALLLSMERSRAMDLNDAFIEQQNLAERFRAMQRGDRT